jgi:hypothetical protein
MEGEKVIQRQAIITSIAELLGIVAELKREDISLKQKVQLNIINKQTTSDTWKFEKVK